MTAQNRERLAKIRNPDNFTLQRRNCKLQYAEFAAFQEKPDAKGLSILAITSQITRGLFTWKRGTPGK